MASSLTGSSVNSRVAGVVRMAARSSMAASFSSAFGGCRSGGNTVGTPCPRPHLNIRQHAIAGVARPGAEPAPVVLGRRYWSGCTGPVVLGRRYCVAMRLGIHLPQFGRAAVAGAVEDVARRAESVGFDGVWVRDHLVVPVGQPYPSPYLYDPLMALAFAAAVTDRIGIGTSVLVAPQYTSPLALANSLASLDSLSNGRLTVGAGIGWSAAEYAALGASFDHRGQRLEEILSLWRASWQDDPVSHEGDYYPFRDVRLLPKPARPIPIWLGGASDAA